MRRAILRDRILIAFCSAVAVAITVLIVVDIRLNSALAVDAIEPTVASGRSGLNGPNGSSDTWTLQFLGDTMLSDGAQPFIDVNGYDWPLSGVKPLINGDFVIANAEAPIGTQTVTGNPGKTYSYNSDPRAAGALRRAGINALGLANNHAMDMGAAGLTDTVTFAAANDLVTFGAGMNLAEAERPLILRTPVGAVGVVAFGENFGKSTKAAVDNPGTVALSPTSIQRGIDLAHAAGAEWVVAYVHWGDNYSDTTPQQRFWAQTLAAAGYDLVVGTGPHISGPIEFINDTPVAYSIGNFVFGAPGRFKSFGKDGIGLLLSVELNRTGPAQLAVGCILTDNLAVGFVPQPCTPQQAEAIIPTVHPELIVGGAIGRMPCACFRPVASNE